MIKRFSRMNDPLSFCKAEDYFGEATAWGGPSGVASVSQTPPQDVKEKDYWRAVNLTFDDGTICVVQYVRPTLWRVRYDPTVTDASQYGDVNGLVFRDSFCEKGSIVLIALSVLTPIAVLS